jgi:glutathione S-transferase
MLKGMKNTFKLYYFDRNFRAQAIRAILNWVKVNWEDIKLTNEDFETMVSRGVFVDSMNQLPMLEYKGNIYTQTHAIEFYLAKKFKLLGRNDEEEQIIITIQGIVEDVISLYSVIVYPRNQQEEKDQEKNLKIFIEEKLPYFLGVIERLYTNKNSNNNLDISVSLSGKENTNLYSNANVNVSEVDFNNPNFNNENNNLNNYFLGNKISLADFIVGTFFYNLIYHPLRKGLLLPVLESSAPILAKLITKIVKEDLQEYYKDVFINHSII